MKTKRQYSQEDWNKVHDELVTKLKEYFCTPYNDIGQLPDLKQIACASRTALLQLIREVPEEEATSFSWKHTQVDNFLANK